MRIAAIAFAVVAALVLAVVYLFPSTSTPLDAALSKESNGRITGLSDVPNHEVKALAEDAIAEMKKPPAERKIDDQLAKNKQKLKENLDKIDGLITDMADVQGDSAEYLAWKKAYRDCLERIKQATSQADLSTEQAALEYSNRLAPEVKKCSEETAKLKDAISKPEEKKKADDQDAKNKQVIGALMIIGGVIYLLYGGDPETAFKLIAAGMAMLTCGLDPGACEDGGDNPNSGGGTVPVEQHGAQVPDQYKNEGFDAVEGTGGELLFIYSDKADKGQWKVLKANDAQMQGDDGDTSRWTEFFPKDGAKAKLATCIVAIDLVKKEIKFSPKAAASQCPKATLVAKTGDFAWEITSDEQAPVTTGTGTP